MISHSGFEPSSNAELVCVHCTCYPSNLRDAQVEDSGSLTKDNQLWLVRAHREWPPIEEWTPKWRSNLKSHGNVTLFSLWVAHHPKNLNVKLRLNFPRRPVAWLVWRCCNTKNTYDWHPCRDVTAEETVKKDSAWMIRWCFLLISSSTSLNQDLVGKGSGQNLDL